MTIPPTAFSSAKASRLMLRGRLLGCPTCPVAGKSRRLPPIVAACCLTVIFLTNGCNSRADIEPNRDAKPAAGTANPVVERQPDIQSRGGGSWPLFRGNAAGTGVADTILPDKLELLWKFTPETERSSFITTAAIANGTVFVGDAMERLYALDLSTGREKWSIAGELGFVAPPAVDDQRLFIGDSDGVFRCYDAQTGEELWRHEADGEINAGANFYQDTVLFASQDGNLTRLNKKNGEVVWQFNIQAEGGIQCTPTLGGSNVFFAGCDGKFHILNIHSGDDEASVEIGGPTLSSPAVLGDFAYFGTENGDVVSVNWRKPETVWTYRSEKGNQAYRSSAAVDADVIIVAGRDKMVRALKPEDGEPIWEFAAKARLDSSPVIVGDRVYVGSSDGRIYGLDKASGERVWEFDAGGEFIAGPAVADGKLVIGNKDGTVYCFGAKHEN